MVMKYRVLHAPTTVGGNPQGLSRALKEIGVSSASLTLAQNYFNYPCDIVVWKENDTIFMRELKRIWWLFSAPFRYEILHFNFGSSFAGYYGVNLHPKEGFSYVQFLKWIYSKYLLGMQTIELSLLKLLKKPVFVTYQGDDARQGDYCLANFEISIATQVDDGYYNIASDEFKRKSIERLDKCCERIYSVNPDLMHVLPQRTVFVPYSHVFMDEWRPIFTQTENRPLRIVHAPSHRQVKGTDIIIAALDQLKAQGYSFELLLVEGMSNAEARKVYETADVLVDQLFAGWYGGLAVELMALGKPVLVYIREDDLKYIPPEMKSDLPFVNVNPSTIEDGLRDVFEMSREQLLDLARKSRAFVERWHDPVKIAKQIKVDYENSLRRKKNLKTKN